MRVVLPTLISISWRGISGGDRFREPGGDISGSQLRLIDRDHLFILNEPELIVEPALRFLATVDAAPETRVVQE